MDTEYLDWAAVGEFKGDMKSHMQRVLDSDIMVSSVGTALMYLPFLRDGSSFVALGQILDETTMGPKRQTPSFMEQHMSAGANYVKTFYYDPKERLKGLDADHVKQLIRTAAQTTRSGFKIPLDVSENLSPEGRVVRGICEKDAEACQRITDIRNQGPWDCVRGIWTEYIVYEIGPWGPGGACNWPTARTGFESLRALRKEYGLPGFGAAEV